MPVTTFDQKNKLAGDFKYPRLMLKKDQRARVFCIENQPTYEWVHRLAAPKLDENNEPVMVERKTRNGTTLEMDTDFISRTLCPGDYTVIESKGADPDGCYACKMAMETEWVPGPDRRFAMHVIQYALAPTGEFQLAVPFTPFVVAWVFAERVFNTLVDKAAEWGELNTIDLLLGPCTQETFQTFEIAVAKTCQARASQEHMVTCVNAYKENKAEDLQPLLGRKPDAQYMRRDVDMIIHKSRIAHGVSNPTPTAIVSTTPNVAADVVPSTTQTLDELISGASTDPIAALTTEAPVLEEAAPAEPGPALSLEDMLGDSTSPVHDPVADLAAAPEAEEPAPAEEAPPAVGGESIDDILKSLG